VLRFTIKCIVQISNVFEINMLVSKTCFRPEKL
jgi:hypothetical protein